MTITPLTAAAVPAGIAAVKLVQHLHENQPFRQLLSQVGSSPKTDEAALESPTASEQLDQFLTLVRERLATAGVNTSIRFEITSDAQGNLQIAGDHPYRAEMERALLGDPEIAQAFHRLASTHQRAALAQRHEQFAQQYLADGTATFSPNEPGTPQFAVLINGDEAEIRPE